MNQMSKFIENASNVYRTKTISLCKRSVLKQMIFSQITFAVTTHISQEQNLVIRNTKEDLKIEIT